MSEFKAWTVNDTPVEIVIQDAAVEPALTIKNVSEDTLFELKLVRDATGDTYGYGLNIDSDAFFRGTAAQKSYLVSISGDRESGYVATGDSNDALLKLNGSNYAANDTNFIFRGLNGAIANRSGGTLGRIEHSLGTQGKSGGTVGTIMALSLTAENYGTVSDLFGGLDVLLKNEAAVATTEFGIRVRNENNSIAGTVNSVFLVSETGANTGFSNLFTFSGLADASGAMIFDNTLKCDVNGTDMFLVMSSTEGVLTFEPARVAGGYCYGVDIAPDDTFFGGGAATKSYLLSVRSDRPSGSAATGDSNDALVKVSGSNYAANDTNFIFRSINATVTNRSGGTLGRLENSISVQGKSGGTVGTMLGATIKAENYGTVSDEFGGLDLIVTNEAAVATLEYGLRIRNVNNSIAGDVTSAILITKSGANTGFTNLFTLLDDGHPASLTNGSDLNDISATANAGWIKVVVGSTTRYIALYAVKA